MNLDLHDGPSPSSCAELLAANLHMGRRRFGGQIASSSRKGQEEDSKGKGKVLGVCVYDPERGVYLKPRPVRNPEPPLPPRPTPCCGQFACHVSGDYLLDSLFAPPGILFPQLAT